VGTRIWSFFVKLERICKKFGDHPKSQKFRPKKSPSPTTKSKSHHHLLTHLSQLLPNRFRQPPPLSLTTSSYFRINIRHISATIPSFVPPIDIHNRNPFQLLSSSINTLLFFSNPALLPCHTQSAPPQPDYNIDLLRALHSSPHNRRSNKDFRTRFQFFSHMPNQSYYAHVDATTFPRLGTPKTGWSFGGTENS
jgi:hypothetical protein